MVERTAIIFDCKIFVQKI
jgi:hypothetical protein